jgi:SAM-dependent methyltransferase
MTPRPFVEEIARELPPGLALDLACGDGRNAIWLADRGWQVTAIDRAPAFTDPRIDIRTADLEQHEYTIEPAAWDLIVMSYYLQPGLYPAMMRGLKPGGIAIVIVLLEEPGRAGRFRLKPGQLRDFFRDQEVLAYREDGAIAQIALRRDKIV